MALVQHLRAHRLVNERGGVGAHTQQEVLPRSLLHIRGRSQVELATAAILLAREFDQVTNRHQEIQLLRDLATSNQAGLVERANGLKDCFHESARCRRTKE
jgi:hypothetical protein